MVELRGVTRRLGATLAVDELTLSVAAGELVTVVGPSGAGKSTVLRLIAGLERPDAGTVALRGRDVTTKRASERGVAMVFQSFALFPHLSVADNIGFGLARARRARSRSAGRGSATSPSGCRWRGCSAAGRRELSGGERQRVALARGLVGDPDVLLLDEPLSNLDALLRVELRAELRKVHDDTGLTMVHVTHDQGEALSLGDRVAVLREGRRAARRPRAAVRAAGERLGRGIRRLAADEPAAGPSGGGSCAPAG